MLVELAFDSFFVVEVNFICYHCKNRAKFKKKNENRDEHDEFLAIQIGSIREIESTHWLDSYYRKALFFYFIKKVR